MKTYVLSNIYGWIEFFNYDELVARLRDELDVPSRVEYWLHEIDTTVPRGNVKIGAVGVIAWIENGGSSE